MSQYLVLSYIDIQNANSIAGLTWGFPAITQFLGFTHALNRKISNGFTGKHPINLSGCSVIAHKTQNKAYQPKKYADFEFLQSKNPPVLAKHKSASPPPIIEEGKVNLTVSLIIEISQPLALTADQAKSLEKEIMEIVYQMRVAGGNVLDIRKAKLLSASTDEQEKALLRKVKRLIMPGFMLIDRSHYLKEHYQQLIDKHNEESEQGKPELIDAWLDFAALKYWSIPQLTDKKTVPDENTPANWVRIEKPMQGYLVPIMTGYKAISDVYAEGEILNTRDENTQSCFVEAVHSVGEWQSVHRMDKIENTIWQYRSDGPWYLCQQKTAQQETHKPEANNDVGLDSEQTLTINEALATF